MQRFWATCDPDKPITSLIKDKCIKKRKPNPPPNHLYENQKPLIHKTTIPTPLTHLYIKPYSSASISVPNKVKKHLEIEKRKKKKRNLKKAAAAAEEQNK